MKKYILRSYSFVAEVTYKTANFASSRNQQLEFSRINFYRIDPKLLEYTLLKSHLKSQNTFPRFLLRLYSVLLSSKLQAFNFVIENNKSLINILKSRGLGIETCGTLVLVPYLSYHEY